MAKREAPSFDEERALQAEGYRYIAGIDEAGRGALAGPVVAGAVILPRRMKAGWLGQVRDSKLLSPDERRYLFDRIHEAAVSVAVGIVSHQIIDEKGIVEATKLAMRLAVEKLSPPPQTLLIDYLVLPDVPLPQKGIVKGDYYCFSIACASIIAKVSRDRLMIKMDGLYSGYGLARHKGYGTEEHRARVYKLGPSPIHRRSFQPVKNIIAAGRYEGSGRYEG